MLQPTRTKFRKAHKGRIHGNASRCNFMNYGSYGLKAMSPDRVISKQIEAARVALTRHMKRQGRVWTRVFPNIPVSKKPTEVRMGKGKGSPEFWACRVKPGKIYKKIYMMKKKETKKITRDQAMKDLDKLKKDLFNFRFQKVNGQLTNPSKINITKKSIARLKTIIERKADA